MTAGQLLIITDSYRDGATGISARAGERLADRFDNIAFNLVADSFPLI